MIVGGKGVSVTRDSPKIIDVMIISIIIIIIISVIISVLDY